MRLRFNSNPTIQLDELVPGVTYRLLNIEVKGDFAALSSQFKEMTINNFMDSFIVEYRYNEVHAIRTAHSDPIFSDEIVSLEAKLH